MDVALFRWKLALLLAATASLYGCQLGAAGVVSEEDRWAEVAREMRATGDYLHPTINGKTYYDKPVGSYWLIVAASHLTGGVNEMAARLPAAIAGVLGVWLLALLGRRLSGDNVGLLGGAILATSFGYTFYSRRATADIETVAGVLAALSLFVRYRERGGPWVLLLWLIMAGTSLTKGLLGFALPIAVMGAETLVNVWKERRLQQQRNSVPPTRFAERIDLPHKGGGEKTDSFFPTSPLVGEVAPNAVRSGWGVLLILRHGRWFFNRWTILAVPMGVGLYLLPFLLSVNQTGATDGLQMVWCENVKRFVNPHNHTGPVYLYAGVIFVLAIPWSAFLLPAIMGKPRTDGERFIRVYFWAIFAFFTISASRRSYYLLPVLPPLALLLADLLLRPREELSNLRRRLRDCGYAVFAVGLFLSGLGLLSPSWVLPAPYSELPPLPYRAAFAVGWVAALGMLCFRWSPGFSRSSSADGKRRPAEAGTPTKMAIVAFALFFYGFGIAWPAFEELRTRRAFVQEVHQHSDGELLVLFHARDVVFDLGRTAPEYTDANELLNAMNAGKVKWIIARRRYLEGLNLPIEVVVEETSRPWEAADQAGNKLVLLKVRNNP